MPLPDHAKKKPPPASRRVQEALAQPSMREEAQQEQQQELRLSVSDKEILQKKDFAQMSAAEIATLTVYRRVRADDEFAGFVGVGKSDAVADFYRSGVADDRFELNTG